MLLVSLVLLLSKSDTNDYKQNKHRSKIIFIIKKWYQLKKETFKVRVKNNNNPF